MEQSGESTDRHGTTDGDERLVTGYGGRLFLLISIGWFGVTIGRQILPPVLPVVISDLGITPFQAGAALTVLWAMRALNNYPGGRLADQLSRKTVLVGAMIVLTLGFALLSAAIVYPLFIFAVAVIGVGAGLYSVSIRAATADLYVEKRAQAFGLQNAISMIGSASAAGVAVFILAIGTWRSAFLPTAFFFILIVFLLHRRMREPYVLDTVDLAVTETTQRILGTTTVRRALIAYVLWFFAWQGMIGFLPTFLQVEKEFSPALASAGFAAVYVIGIGVGPLSGAIGDRYTKLPVVIGSLLISALGLASLLVSDSLVVIAAAIFTVAVGFISFPPAMQAYLMDTFDDASMGGDLGAVKTTYGVVGSLGPTYVGLVAVQWNYSIAFGGIVVCLLAGLLVVISSWHS